MSERALRGSRLGATSYENDRDVDFADRQTAAFDCPKGHHFEIPFAAEAELPPTWECRFCGATATRVDAEQPEAKRSKPPRTHWDMLMERRTITDLEELLAERLEILRARGVPSGDHRKSA
jgi:rubredoxin